MESKRKKIPVFTYLCFLLAVAVLFTGVTLSRYVTSSGGGATTSVSPFIYSYTIDDVSSNSFANVNYWLGDDNKTAMNSAKLLRYTVRNYRTDSSGGASVVSDVDLKSSLRLHIPAEFADVLALQVARMENGIPMPVTPQYSLSKFIYGDGDSGYASGTRKVNTADFADYNEIAGAREETMTVTGGFTKAGDKLSGTVTATADTENAEEGNVLSLTAETGTIDYSVGFKRGKEVTIAGVPYNDMSGTVFYLDCNQEMDIYTVDIVVPSMFLTGGTAEEKSFILYLTMTKSITNKDYSANAFDNGYLEGNGEFNGAAITGYHFNLSDATVYETEADLTNKTNGVQASVRYRKIFSGGGAKDYKDYYYLEKSDNSYLYAMTELKQGTYSCENGTFVSLEGCSTYPLESSDGEEYVIGESIGKVYSMQANVLFIQASDILASAATEGGGA